MSITRPPAARTPEEWDRIIEAAARRGASIQMSDPRVTNAQTWILSTIGVVIIGLGGWMVKSINEQTLLLAKVALTIEYLQRDQNNLRRDFDNHLNSVVKPLPDIRERQ